MIEIKVPTVGESINEVTLIKWLKKDGDYVERDEVIAELESEKATFEVNAEQAGILKTKAAEDSTLNIGDVLAEIDDSAAKPAQGGATTEKEPASQPKEAEAKNIESEKADAPAPKAEAPTAKAAGKGIIDIKVPAIGESITEVTLLKWLKNDGDLVNRDEVIAEFESEKATFEVNAEQPGKLKHNAT